jgi:signal transduction histidine kinase
VLADNSGNQFYEPLTMLISACFIAMLVHNFVRIDNRRAISYLLPALQILLSMPILFLDQPGDSLYLVLVMGISVLNRSSLPQAKVYGVCILSAYLLGSTAHTIRMFGISEMGVIVRFFYINTLLFLAALTAFYALKKQMITNDRLDAALQKVREQSEQLRDMAVIEERNRIAAEMHDSVGHTLVAAILTLETAENILVQRSGQPRQLEQPQQSIQPEQSPQVAQVLARAKELMRCGISELGASVRAARAKKKTKFTAALEQLLSEIGENTGLVIKSVVGRGVEESLPPLQAGILLSAVKECATNALKHGHASQADILIQEYKGQIQFAFTDNGVGADALQIGSGLSIMHERIAGIGGELKTETVPGEGFTVSITIPAGQRKGEALESNQRITCG